MLQQAWADMQRADLVGSSTVCLVALHPHRAELRAANVGDSGFLILRPSGGAAGERPETLGTLDAMARGDGRSGGGSYDSGDFYVAFRSPQQLRAFNAPYQLGRAPDATPGAPDGRFETPHDAAKVRFPVRSGDVVLLATDGLFDNMEEEAVLEVLSAAGAGAPVQQIAQQLAHRAHALSLDTEVDSPFATLAKENDILWGGGRPDDITVIVSRVVDPTETPAAAPAPFAAVTGPGEAPPAITELPALADAEPLVAERLEPSWD